MKKNNSSFVALIFGALFIALGLLMLVGLITFAAPCDRLLDNGMPARCDSLGFMQRGLAIVVMALGLLMILFRTSAEWIKALVFVAFLMGAGIIISAAVITDTCNVRAHNCEILVAADPDLDAPSRNEAEAEIRTQTSEWPDVANRQVHRGMLDGEDIHIVWTNFNCNQGPFIPFVATIGILVTLLAAVYALFVDSAALMFKPCLRNMGIVFVVLGGFTLLALFTLFPPCLDLAGTNLMPMFMRCFDVAMHVNGIAIITALSGLLMILFSRARDFCRGLNTAIGLLGLLAIAIPIMTETCASPDMICNTRPFAPFMMVMGVLILLASLVNMFLLNKKDEDEYETEE